MVQRVRRGDMSADSQRTPGGQLGSRESGPGSGHCSSGKGCGQVSLRGCAGGSCGVRGRCRGRRRTRGNRRRGQELERAGRGGGANRQEAVTGDAVAEPGTARAPRARPLGSGELRRASVAQWPGSISPRVGRPKGGVEPGPAREVTGGRGAWRPS